MLLVFTMKLNLYQLLNELTESFGGELRKDAIQVTKVRIKLNCSIAVLVSPSVRGAKKVWGKSLLR